MAAVKVELATPDASAPNAGFLECAVEVSKAVTADFGGRTGQELGDELTKVINRCVEGFGLGV